MRTIHRPRLVPALALPVLLAMIAAACGDAARRPAASPPVAASPAPSASATRTSPYGATPATPGDEQNDNEGCKRRRNSGALAECSKVTDNLGGWAPTLPEMVEAMKHAGGVCYCAEGLHVPAETCARRVGASTVGITVGKEGEPTDCRIDVSAVSWSDRRWIVVSAFNRDVSTFYGVVSIQARTEKGFETYFEGFNDFPSDGEVQAGAQGVSPAMKRDWPALPAEVKKALGAR